ncbi:MAG TPA: polyhydroxyalkanoic acid system family protein [Polyangiales bacterium]|nr:polyhydroxyalkanoic acid system family protein [Polyangiales bacterium]
MKGSIKHDLTPAQLRLAVTKFAEAYVQRFAEYNATTSWLSDDKVEVRFKVKGVNLAGQLELLPREIALDMKVPLPFQLFRSRALKAIEDEVTPWLARAKAGELG